MLFLKKKRQNPIRIFFEIKKFKSDLDLEKNDYYPENMDYLNRKHYKNRPYFLYFSFYFFIFFFS